MTPDHVPDHIADRAMQFLRHDARFAQVFTVNRDGFPIGRTMGAPIAPDWTVPLIQRRTHGRLGQLRHNPQIEIVWAQPPAPDSTNDHPHVFDFGWLIPRVVFLRGTAEFMDDEWTVEQYQRTFAALAAAGHHLAPARSPDEARHELAGVKVHPIQIRVEGFGVGAETFTWQIERQP